MAAYGTGGAIKQGQGYPTPGPVQTGRGGSAPPPPPPPPSTLPTPPVIPTRAAPDGTALSYVGPYEWDQPLAQQAYQNALAAVQQQRASTYLQYGVNQGGQEVDPAANPYGLFQQAQRQGADAASNLHASIHSRGFHGGGIEGQAESAGQLANGQVMQTLANSLLGADTGLHNAETTALADLNQRLFQDRLNSINYAQQQGLFTPAANQRSDQQVKQMVNAAAKQWVQRFGSLTAKNQAGQTFQQRLDAYGQKIYDPLAALRFGGKMFGGT